MIIDNVYADYALRIFASLVCGSLLGLERKSKQHAVGLRTLILISMSSCLLTLLSILMAVSQKVVDGKVVEVSGDCTRIAASIVTGVGFLGAGAIIRTGMNIRGLTTAAIIWTSSSLGVACGAGEYFITIVTLALVMVSLFIFSKVEYKFFPAEKSKILTIVYSTLINENGVDAIDVKKVRAILVQNGVTEHDLNITQSIKDEKTILRFWVKTPDDFDSKHLIESLLTTGVVTKVSVSDE